MRWQSVGRQTDHPFVRKRCRERIVPVTEHRGWGFSTFPFAGYVDGRRRNSAVSKRVPPVVNNRSSLLASKRSGRACRRAVLGAAEIRQLPQPLDGKGPVCWGLTVHQGRSVGGSVVAVGPVRPPGADWKPSRSPPEVLKTGGGPRAEHQRGGGPRRDSWSQTCMTST